MPPEMWSPVLEVLALESLKLGPNTKYLDVKVFLGQFSEATRGRTEEPHA
jgi:hypothetical protein